MRCQWCGFEITNPNAVICPNCGSTLAPAATASQGSGQSGWQQASSAHDRPASAPPPNVSQPPAPPMPSYPGASQPNAPLATPDALPGAIPGGAPAGVPPMPPPYGWPAPPSMPYGAPAYGQPLPPGVPYAASPTYPLPGYGAPPSMPYGAPYIGYPAGAPLGPPPSPRRRRTGLIVGISIAAVVVVCAGGLGILSVLGRQFGSIGILTNGMPIPITPTASVASNETIIYQNDMVVNTNDWSDDTHCFLGTGGYHVEHGYICYAPVGDQTNVDIRVDVMQINGPANNGYGITVRSTSHTANRYDFLIAADGHWAFFKCLAGASQCTLVDDWQESSMIHGGLNTKNTLELKVTGSQFIFSINGTKVGEAHDSSLTSGQVGLVVPGNSDNAECVFTNFVAARPS